MLPDFDYLNPDLAEHRLILKEDLLTLTAIRDIQSIETLIELLRSRVGSPVSATALAQDLRHGAELAAPAGRPVRDLQPHALAPQRGAR